MANIITFSLLGFVSSFVVFNIVNKKTEYHAPNSKLVKEMKFIIEDKTYKLKPKLVDCPKNAIHR
jgi:hypothetical protein